VEHLASMKKPHTCQFDVVIVGGGPAGLSAALAAQAKGLTYVVLEQDSIGGSVYHYPRQKLVLTSSVELPLHGILKVSEISKEELLGIWEAIVKGFKLNILTQHKVEGIQKRENGFEVKAGEKIWTSANVLLAIGRRGSPRKLGVPGEDLPKVAYKLIEAKSFHHKNILVVGGGDSAVEAAIALATQTGNVITMSYRRDSFVRLKEKNEQRIAEQIKSKKVTVRFNSTVESINPSTAVLVEKNGTKTEIPNDLVFIFAGGELPTEILKRAGVRLRTSEVEAQAA